MTTHLRVLSINGGGIKGLMPAKIIEYISKQSGKNVTQLFDFVIGTSIGGILASAYTTPSSLGSQLPKYNATEIVKLIEEKGSMIFSNPSSGFLTDKYSREGIDKFLEQYLKVNGSDIMLTDTIVPIALTAQNNVNDIPQIWSSCSKQFSVYLLKDVAGATSAAPTYFGPKYIPVNNQTSCNTTKFVEKDGQCFYELIDGGVFANSPTILLPVLLRNVLTGKATEQCSKKFANIISRPYPIFWTDYSSDGTPNNHVVKQYPSWVGDWQNSYSTTVVQVGTGYFEHLDDHSSNMLSGPASVLLGLGMFGIFIGVLGIGLYIYQKYQDKYQNSAQQLPTSINENESLIEHTQNTGIIPYINAYKGAMVIGGTLLAVSSLLLRDNIQDASGKIGFMVKNTNGVEKILKGNEDMDWGVSRDVYGAISINPDFKEKIEMDDVSIENIQKMNSITDLYIQQNADALNKLAACLSRSDARLDICVDAQKYFYDNFRDNINHNIES